MPLWILLIGILFSFSSFAQAPRPCEVQVNEILALDGTLLAPISETLTLNQIKTAIADTTTAMRAAERNAPPRYNHEDEKRPQFNTRDFTSNSAKGDLERQRKDLEALSKERQRMNDRYYKATQPAFDAHTKALKPLRNAALAGMSTWDRKTGVSTYHFDKIEQHGTDEKHLNRIYSKDNRVVALEMHQYHNRLSFIFDKDCRIEKIQDYDDGPDYSSTGLVITPALCQNRTWNEKSKPEMIIALGGSMGFYATPDSAKNLRRMCNTFAKVLNTNTYRKSSQGLPKETDK